MKLLLLIFAPELVSEEFAVWLSEVPKKGALWILALSLSMAHLMKSAVKSKNLKATDGMHL